MAWPYHPSFLDFCHHFPSPTPFQSCSQSCHLHPIHDSDLFPPLLPARPGKALVSSPDSCSHLLLRVTPLQGAPPRSYQCSLPKREPEHLVSALRTSSTVSLCSGQLSWLARDPPTLTLPDLPSLPESHRRRPHRDCHSLPPQHRALTVLLYMLFLGLECPHPNLSPAWQTFSHSRPPVRGPQTPCTGNRVLLCDPTALLFLHGPCHVALGSVCLSAPSVVLGLTSFKAGAKSLPPLSSAFSIALSSQ